MIFAKQIGPNEIEMQNLLEDMDFKGECEMPDIEFIGFIDDDDVPDVIIKSSSNSMTRWTLWLSTLAEEGEMLKKVGAYDWGNCN